MARKRISGSAQRGPLLHQWIASHRPIVDRLTLGTTLARALNGIDITPSSSETFRFNTSRADNLALTGLEETGAADFGSSESPVAPKHAVNAATAKPVLEPSGDEIGIIAERASDIPPVLTPSTDASKPIVTSNDPVVEEQVIEDAQEATPLREQVIPPTGIPEADADEAEPIRPEPSQVVHPVPDSPPTQRSVQSRTDDTLQGDASSSPTEAVVAAATPIEPQELESVESVEKVINEQVETVDSGIDTVVEQHSRPPATDSVNLNPHTSSRQSDVPVQPVQQPVRSQLRGRVVETPSTSMSPRPAEELHAGESGN